jgi:hypothetical protein
VNCWPRVDWHSEGRGFIPQGSSSSLTATAYSARNTSAGSILIARNAGIDAAAKAVAISETNTIAKIVGSAACVSNNSDYKTRVVASPPATPAQAPKTTGRIAIANTNRTMSPGVAPSAAYADFARSLRHRTNGRSDGKRIALRA